MFGVFLTCVCTHIRHMGRHLGLVCIALAVLLVYYAFYVHGLRMHRIAIWVMCTGYMFGQVHRLCAFLLLINYISPIVWVCGWVLERVV